MFAALANDGDEVSCTSSTSSSSSSSNALARDFASGVAVAVTDASSSSSDDDDVDEQDREDLWRWSTGRTASAASQSQPRVAKPTKLLRGEKKRLKALHVAETRARRAAQVPDGFVAADARTRMESVVRTGRGLTIVCSARGHVAKAQGRVIRAISRALGAKASERRRGKRLVFDIERVHGVSRVPVEGEQSWEDLKRVCAPPMTREEYLKSDERRERVAKEAAARASSGKPKNSRGRIWNRKDDDETGRVRTSETTSRAFKIPVRVDFERAGSYEDDMQIIQQSTAAAPRTASVVSEDFGVFERHTRGIGARLLAKMGFRAPGEGLGASSQGIAEVPTSETRTKRAGLGS